MGYVWEKVIKRLSKRKGKKFWLLDGPPYPNAEPHMGHVRGVSTKDMIIKLKAMQGFRVRVKPGFDTHGLPIENKVEKEQGIVGKNAIESVGIAEFMQKCRQFATGNIDTWMKFYKEMGVWFGWEEPYMTLQKDYMDSVWWSVSELWKKNLLKQGKEPFYWCPDCQTVLSGYEVTDEYYELDDPSVFVKFPTDKGFSLLAWTTTPWTLPANVALIVRGDADYVKVKVGGEFIVLAKDLLKSLDSASYEVVETFKGKALKGLKYGPVFDCKAQHSLDDSQKARRVYLSKAVIKQKVAGKVAEKKEVKDETLVEHFTNLDEGTGIVHCAPGHGPADFELSKEYGLEALSPVDEAGRFTQDVGEFAGEHVRESNFKIADYLKKKGLLLDMKKIRHRYPVCWRCKTPLIFRMTEQWLLDIEQIKGELIEAAKSVEWLPEFALERMVHWLANAKNWTLSRQRYWNTPLPIWKCSNDHIKVVSGSQELSKLSGREIPDLHRDVVDGVVFPCKECGSEMRRIPDVLDVWYDSGAASFAVPGYPRNKKEFQNIWPTDWIDEGQDQIRGWFYTLLVLGVALFGKPPYERVSMHGWVVDKKGNKMSKSKGNFVTGNEALSKLGADILRFYVLWEASPLDIMKFNPERAKKEIGRMLLVWKNLHSYLMKFSKGEPKKGKLALEDKWILSKYNSLVSEFIEDFEGYKLHYATRKVFGFIIEDLSRKYMKLAKERVRAGKETPLWVLKTIHSSLLKLVAPITPFITEEMHAEYSKQFSGEESVFLEAYPEPDEKAINKELEATMDSAFDIIEAILAYRDKKRIGLKYPLRQVSIKGFDYEETEQAIQLLAHVKAIKSTKGDVVKLGDIEIIIDPTQGKEEINEGLMREVSRRIRSLRRKKGTRVSDQIELYLWGDSGILDAVKSKGADFKHRVGASSVNYSEGGSLREEWNIKGKKISAGI